MTQRCDSVLESIGQTPLVRIRRLAPESATPIYAKVEFVNPGGSAKDRIALSLVEAAEREGHLKPGATIIEAAPGQFGASLAMVAAVKGYKCILVVPDRTPAELVRLFKSYGARVVLTPASAASNSPEGYQGVAARMAQENPNAIRLNHFANPDNPNYHYECTGPEIWRQTEGKITAFVSGIETGGTISGVGRYLKEKNSKIQIVAADPEGSILSDDQPKPWASEGDGQDSMPKTLDTQVIDEWIRVSDAESFSTARNMARQEGLLVGSSSGTAMAAGLRYAQRLTGDDLLIVMCPDTGRNHLSQMYSDEWMLENGFLTANAKRHTVGDLLDARGSVPLIAAHPDDRANDALGLLRKHGVSQLPVIENGQVVGCVRDLTLARLQHARFDPRQVSVREIMANPLPTVDEHVDIDEIYRLLSSGHSGIVATRDNGALSLLSRMDLISYWNQATEEMATTPEPATPTAVS